MVVDLRPVGQTLAHLSRSDALRAIGGRGLTWLGWAVMAFYCATSVVSLVWLTYGALKGHQEWLVSGLALPKRIAWENFETLWQVVRIDTFAFNSVYITAISVAGTVFLSAMAAYVIARIEFWRGLGNKIVLFYAISSMMVPFFLYLVPLYFLMRDFGLVNSHVGLILLYMHAGMAFDIFVLTGFFKTLPSELEEAATIDGASPMAIYWKIMLPLASPGLITVAIFNTIWYWNEFFLALVFLRERELHTIPIGMWSLLGGWVFDYGVLFAGAAAMILPMLILFAIFQSRITKGLTVGALKG